MVVRPVEVISGQQYRRRRFQLEGQPSEDKGSGMPLDVQEGGLHADMFHALGPGAALEDEGIDAFQDTESSGRKLPTLAYSSNWIFT